MGIAKRLIIQFFPVHLKGAALLFLCHTWKTEIFVNVWHLPPGIQTLDGPPKAPYPFSLGASLLSQNSLLLPTFLHLFLFISYFLTIPHSLCSLFLWTHNTINTILFSGFGKGNGCILPNWSCYAVGRMLYR